jgi:hypothetical protein
MRLIDRLPELEDGEGNLWTHNTGGEHAMKFIGSEHAYNPLRASELRRLDDSPLDPIDHEQLVDMLQGYNQEVIFVDRHNLPEGKEGARGLVAASIAERSKTGRFDKRIKVVELVVHPDLRQRQIASFMLGRAVNLEHFGSGDPTELVVDTSTYHTDDWFREKLVETGFKHTDEDGSPAMWLPGSAIYSHANLDDPEEVEKLLEPMPDDWNGHLELYPETDPQTQVFRQGKLLGIVRGLIGSARFEDEERVADFMLYDAAGVELDLLQGISRDDALIAILNNYDLVKTV